MKQLGRFLYFLACVCTAMIGYGIHGSIFWSIVDFFFAPLAWGKWLVCHEISITVIKHALGFFMQ